MADLTVSPELLDFDDLEMKLDELRELKESKLFRLLLAFIGIKNLLNRRSPAAARISNE